MVAWCLLAIGDSAKAGYYSALSLTCVSAGFVVLLVVVAEGGRLEIPDRRALALPAVVCVVAAIVDPTGDFLYLHGAAFAAVVALGIAAALAAAVVLVGPSRWVRWSWVAALVLAVTTGLVTIVVVNNPGIDVWQLLQQSSSGLLHGKNMYQQHWTDSTGLQAVYPYLPATTLLVAPFRWLFGDVRFGLLTAAVVGALVVRRIGRPGTSAVAVLLVVLPGWALLVNRAWTEPLLLAALAIAVLAIRSERPLLAVIALALALACKQHILLLLPLFAVWPSFGLRRTLAAIGLAALVVLPWVIASPGSLWHDAVHANLALGVAPRSLSLPGLLLHHDIRVGFWFAGVFLAGAYALTLWRLPRTASGLALGCATVMWAFDLANKQTFFNHYTLPLGLLVLAVAAAERTPAARSVSLRSPRP